MGSSTCGLVLFCGDPLGWSRKGAVDPSFEAEAAAAERHGFALALLDFEALTEGRNPARAVRLVPAVEDGASAQPALYGGWMLRPEQYRQLYEALAQRGVELINDPASYRHCHYLPEWYPLLEAHTPRSVCLPLDDSDRQRVPMDRVMDVLRLFGDSPVIVKDYVKSRKHEWFDACFIRSAADARAVERVVQRFLALQGPDLNEGLVFRKYVELAPLGTYARSGMPLGVEWQVFVLDGEPIWSGAYWEGVVYHSASPSPEMLRPLASRVQSRFFTMDVAQQRDGRWIVIELGDGQVAGLPEPADARDFYDQLAKGWPHDPHDASR